MRYHFLVQSLAASVLACAAGAQQQVQPHRGVLTTLSVGVPGYGSTPSFELTTLGLGLTSIRPGRIGVDAAIGTAPRVLEVGAVALGGRLGAVFPLPITANVMLLPGAGFSGVALTNFEGGAGIWGWNAGMSALVMGSGPVAFRAGVTMHQFEGATTAWLGEAGIAWFLH